MIDLLYYEKQRSGLCLIHWPASTEINLQKLKSVKSLFIPVFFYRPFFSKFIKFLLLVELRFVNYFQSDLIEALAKRRRK